MAVIHPDTTSPTFCLICVPSAVVIDLLSDSHSFLPRSFHPRRTLFFIGHICSPRARLTLLQHLHQGEVGAEILDGHPKDPIHTRLEVHLFGHLRIFCPLLRGFLSTPASCPKGSWPSPVGPHALGRRTKHRTHVLSLSRSASCPRIPPHRHASGWDSSWQWYLHRWGTC